MSRSFRAVAVQPKWHATDFISAAAFRRWMRQQLEQARPHLRADRPNLVVLTELNGLPLVLRGGGWSLGLRNFERVAAALVVARLGRVLPIMRREKVSAVRALQLAGSAENVQLYLQTCRDLAREYGVYLCTGSLPMPRYFLSQGKVQREKGTLTNQAILFGPQGELIGATDKVCLTPEEEAGGIDLTPGRLRELRVFPTPVGDLGVAISLDAFRPEVIRRLENLGCTVLLQPDANGAPWTSLEGLAPDPGHRRDQPVAWLESSWQVTATSSTIRYAINPMVVGNLLDMTFDGQSAITAAPHEAPEPRSYVLTSPRPGFLALAPWVSETGAQGESSAEKLRQRGAALAALSGDPQENNYHTDVLSADLNLPETTAALPATTPHEEALKILLDAPAAQQSQRRWRWLLGAALLGWLWARICSKD